MATRWSMHRLAGLIVAVSLLGLAVPAVQASELSLRADRCWTLMPSAGVISPAGGGVAWRPGWVAGLDVGYYWTGCRQQRLRFALLTGFNVTQFHGAARRFTRGDVLLGIRLNANLGRVRVGARVAFALRIVKDGRYPDSLSPKFGTPVERYVNLGLNVGPELFVRITGWLSFYANADYLLSGRDLGTEFSDHRGHPRHAVVLRLGWMFLI